MNPTNSTYLAWFLLVAASLVLCWVSPWAKSVNDFFRGSKNEQSPNFWLLTSSLVISWLFAKSITNAANLGMSFGIVGGVAYAGYYLSFLTAGIIIYRMRTRGGFRSLHHFLRTRFGLTATLIFSLLIGFRLMNEVWSNSMVIGSYFGETGSGSYYLAIGVFTGLTVAYTLKGGLRSSLLTDAIQMILFGVLLFAILGVILPKTDWQVKPFLTSGSWTLAGGLNLLFVAFLQVLSYPFHDPVLTDRAFIADPKLTLRSFSWATLIGALAIVCFSFIGIYGKMEGLSGQATVVVSRMLGIGTLLMVNFIMVTSAASTLDSTFNSFAKLIVMDTQLLSPPSISLGRWVIVGMALVGTIPILLGAEILAATTISGTMVIGLTPVFLFWRRRFPALSYYASVGFGLLIGTIYALGIYPTAWVWFPGKYGDLLSANLVGFGGALIAFWLPSFFVPAQQSADNIPHYEPTSLSHAD